MKRNANHSCETRGYKPEFCVADQPYLCAVIGHHQLHQLLLQLTGRLLLLLLLLQLRRLLARDESNELPERIAHCALHMRARRTPSVKAPAACCPKRPEPRPGVLVVPNSEPPRPVVAPAAPGVPVAPGLAPNRKLLVPVAPGDDVGFAVLPNENCVVVGAPAAVVVGGFAAPPNENDVFGVAVPPNENEVILPVLQAEQKEV
jgi:hypothetical protein